MIASVNQLLLRSELMIRSSNFPLYSLSLFCQSFSLLKLWIHSARTSHTNILVIEWKTVISHTTRFLYVRVKHIDYNNHHIDRLIIISLRKFCHARDARPPRPLPLNHSVTNPPYSYLPRLWITRFSSLFPTVLSFFFYNY